MLNFKSRATEIVLQVGTSGLGAGSQEMDVIAESRWPGAMKAAPKEPRTQGAHLSPSPITAYGVWGLIYPPLSSVPPFFLLLARKMFFLEPVVTSPLKTTFVSCMWRLVSYSLPSWIPLLLWRFLLWDQSNTTWPQPLLPRVWYFAYYFSYINTLLKNVNMLNKGNCSNIIYQK